MIFNSKFALAASMAMSALLANASPVHVHQAHKRDGDNVAVLTVYVTAGADEAAAVAAPTSAAAPDAPAASSSSTATVVVPTSSGSATASGSSAAPSPPSSSAVGSGGAKGVVYSPYKLGGCKSADEVKSDIAALSGFDVIRIYGVDCDQVPNVLAALGEGQKVFLGIYDVSQISAGLSTINDAIASYTWDIVHSISIGNELVNNGAATVDQIAGYVQSAKSILKGYGYTGPVVSVDTFIAVINNPGLCAISDYVAVNAHAFFDGGITADGAGEWVLQQIQRVSSACGGKNVLITESGWPSQGESNGVAVPSKENQEAAISSIKSTAGDDCILFTAFNDLWKAPGAFNAEQYWGIF